MTVQQICNHRDDEGLEYNDAHGDGTCSKCCGCDACKEDLELLAPTTWDRPMAEHEAEYNAAQARGAQ